MKPIRTERLILRNWEDRDRDLFYRINSDDRVMEFFPFRRDRAESDAMMDRLRDRHRRPTALACRPSRSPRPAPASASSDCTTPSSSRGSGRHDRDRLAAGARILGPGYVTEAAEALLDFGFETLGRDEIVSFAVWNNFRSTAVMERLGMRRDPSRDFDHPRVPDTHPDLKRHALYRLSREDWQGDRKQR